MYSHRWHGAVGEPMDGHLPEMSVHEGGEFTTMELDDLPDDLPTAAPDALPPDGVVAAWRM